MQVFDVIFLIGRMIFAGFFIVSGFSHFLNLSIMTEYAQSKGVPNPKIATIFTGLMLFLGGLGVATGVFVDVSLMLLLIFLIPTSFIMHRFWSVAPEQKQAEKIHFLKNIALAGAIIMLLTLPAGWALTIM